MTQTENFSCKIFVDDDVIYEGNLSEIPEKFRDRIVNDISEWADCLGKSGVNQLLYSHLVWYGEKGKFCISCETFGVDEGEKCEKCDSQLEERHIYERNEKIDKILTCIGMISKIKVV